MSQRQPEFVELYGLRWNVAEPPVAREMDMIARGGGWKTKRGRMLGNGLYFHFRKAIELLWAQVQWNPWLDLIVENWLTHRTIIVIGPASSGKTFGFAVCVLMDYYCFPRTTTGIVCSTSLPRLRDRIWGELSKLHRSAKRQYDWLPGNVIEGDYRIVTDERSAACEGRDFRNGIVGVPCKKGDVYTGLQEFVGIKNKRVRLVGDELSMLPRAFAESISNLDKNPDFKLGGAGNPKETTDALGILAEPAAHLGGWDGAIDQGPNTKVWETRRRDGVCIQLVGSDSPNLHGEMGIPLITQEQIDRDVAFYGRDSLQFTMMDEGRMPRGQGSRRVLTRQMCLKFHAFDPPVWLGSVRTKIAFLDAAYRGVGGDRCIFGTLEFGLEATPLTELPALLASALINQTPPGQRERQVLALTSIEVVPIKIAISGSDLPEDQIVAFVVQRCTEQGIPPANFFYDAGMRSSLVQAFSRIWTPQVNAIDFGGKPSERSVSADIPVSCREHYSKFVTELWYSVRLVVQAGQFRGMTEDAMYEFGAREWKMVAGNKIEVEPKPQMKEKTGRSPDIADAIVCGVEGARQLGFIIRRLVNPERVKQDDKWKDELRQQASKVWRSKELDAKV